MVHIALAICSIPVGGLHCSHAACIASCCFSMSCGYSEIGKQCGAAAQITSIVGHTAKALRIGRHLFAGLVKVRLSLCQVPKFVQGPSLQTWQSPTPCQALIRLLCLQSASQNLPVQLLLLGSGTRPAIASAGLEAGPLCNSSSALPSHGCRRWRSGIDGGSAWHSARHCRPGQGQPHSPAAQWRHDAEASRHGSTCRQH